LIDFGVILSNKVISYFPKGIVNSHFSLLPELRGADPISFAILEGKERTGVSLMLLVEAMDEGPIISIGMFDLDGTETGVSLTQELIQLSHKLLVENLPAYISGNISAVTQEVTMEKFNLQTSYTRKLTKQDGVIDWNKPANMIEREVRAFKDWPKSRTNFSDIEVILLETQVVESKDTTTAPGAIETTDKELVIKCGEDSLQINRLKPVGKKDMDAQSFLAGYKQRIMS